MLFYEDYLIYLFNIELFYPTEKQNLAVKKGCFVNFRDTLRACASA